MDEEQQPPPLPSGDGFTSHIDEMTKTKLYEVMREMKALVEQDRQRVKQFLVDNPHFTRKVFWAQIMLGMMQRPQVMPNTQNASSASQSTQVAPEPKGQSSLPLPVEVGQQGPAISPCQPLVPARQAQIMLGMMQRPQVMPNTQNASSASQSTQVAPEPKGQSSLPQPVEVGQQGPAISPCQPLVPARQGGPHVGPDCGNQVGTSMQLERAPSSSRTQERAMMGAQLLGPPLKFIGHGGQGVGSQPAGPPPQLSGEMEKALLEQVMGLTPEQIHLLPAEQRQQAIQLLETMRNL